MVDDLTACFVRCMAPVTVLVGHAGVGKTNLAVGTALSTAAAGYVTTLADADVVNPYFRSSDYAATLTAAGVRVIAPAAAGTTLDTPSLTGELDAAVEAACAAPHATRVLLDVGGDADGATAIGRWANALSSAGACVAYVTNAFREPGYTTAVAATELAAIEEASHLRVTALVNASNLALATTSADVAYGRAFAVRVSQETGVPLAVTVAPAAALRNTHAPHTVSAGTHAFIAPSEVAAALIGDAVAAEPVAVMPKYVVTPWEHMRVGGTYGTHHC